MRSSENQNEKLDKGDIMNSQGLQAQEAGWAPNECSVVRP